MARFTSRTFYLFFVFVLMAASASAASRTRVIVQPQSFSQGDVLTLSSIARIDGVDPQVVERLQKITLGYAPTIGNSRILTRNEIAAAIESAGIDLRRVDLSMPSSVTIDRASQDISAKQISEAVETYVRDRYSWPADDFSLQISTPPEEVLLPQGALVIRPSAPNFTTPTDRFFVSVALEVDGRIARYVNVELTVEASAVVAVAARQLTRGEAITSDNVRFERRRVGADLRRYVTSEHELQGKAVALSMMEGAIISTTMLNDRMMVKRGDVVSLVARAGTIEVIAAGRARGGGKLGDRIEVLNSSSGRLVVGEVTGDKTVKVLY